MAQLIQMRQRIKAIETIKKVTHAMRLISMSMHSRLRGKTPLLKNYNNELTKIFKKLRFSNPGWTNHIMHPKSPKETNPLLIIIGSQKGLCGNFNTGLFKEFEKTFSSEKLKHTSIIAVGKKAVDYILQKQTKTLTKQFTELTTRNFTDISNQIVDEIIETKKPYSCVTIISNKLKTFFIQVPKVFDLIPLENNIEEDFSKELADDYIWYQDSKDLLNSIAPQYIASNINTALLESLLAEQAARFLSMDVATRNAKTLLEETQLKYNKLRQHKITKELTELSTNF